MYSFPPQATPPHDETTYQGRELALNAQKKASHTSQARWVFGSSVWDFGGAHDLPEVSIVRGFRAGVGGLGPGVGSQGVLVTFPRSLVLGLGVGG